MLVFLCLSDHLDLGLIPHFFRHNALMQTVNHKIIILFDQLVLITGTVNLLRLPAAIGDLPAIYRVLNDIADQCRIKQRILPVVSGNLTDPMVLPFAPISVETHCSKIVRIARASSSLISNTPSLRL